MLELYYITRSTYDTTSASKKTPDRLFFISDTGEIYRGTENYTECCIFYNTTEPPTKAKGKFYINSTTLEGKVWNGTSWVTVIQPVQAAIVTGDTTKPVSSKAVEDYVADNVCVCSTAANLATKAVAYPGFVLHDGSRVKVKFTYTNTNTSATLNVNGTGNVGIRTGVLCESIKSYTWPAGSTIEFYYDGTYWVINSTITGSWTPVVQFGATKATSFTTRNGIYLKSGNVVNLSFAIRCTAPVTGEIKISGFSTVCGEAGVLYSGGGVFLPLYPVNSNNNCFLGYQINAGSLITPVILSDTSDSNGIYSANGQGVKDSSIYLYGSLTYACS